ncbi:ectonucleotide pyrophosphatase/phosphodiesterase [Bacteroides coprosuis]|uniref:alkaline phosphatase family protein n=1 Tax=Bacteroides coprosuis TaxID=151276 RepID=UPI001D64EE9C|nr:ectonucleotide pyrophosphatase/phosphodiesterase [Bacteroides coprosuis]HJD92580.1 ectonucleotide pyrophosphatase/phosphodiesterase [Bacteroides coprosuis]
MKRVHHWLLLCFLVILGACDHSSSSERIYTVLVSLDGFRWDYTELYQTPFLDKMAQRGVSAVMLPSYPASTFPNHYTIATGLTPNRNGLINNTFWDSEFNQTYSMGDKSTRYDPKFYLGEPIWVTAQQQGIKTASIYWVGSDVKIKGTYPDFYLKWDNTPRLNFEQRIDKAIELLSKSEAERPQLIMLYMEEPDGKGHHFGPKSTEVEDEVRKLDKLMGYLMNRIATLPYSSRINLIVTSDHGMTDISNDRFIDMNEYLKPEWCEVVSGRTPTSIFTKPEFRETVYQSLKKAPHIHVWKKEDIPSELAYGSSHRIGDIVVAPELGWQFSNQPRNQKGAHGYFPSDKDMQVMFRAYGPSFKENYIHTDFVNTDIYVLLCNILNIKPANTEGIFNRVEGILANN